jgi:hypothetical protein
LAPTRVLAVIGVDTLQDLGRTIDADAMNHAADDWQRDPKGALDRVLRTLLHGDMDPTLYEDIRRRMSRTPPEVVCAMCRSFGGYNAGAAAAKLKVPIRWHTGHYPMLECPEEFKSGGQAEACPTLSLGKCSTGSALLSPR